MTQLKFAAHFCVSDVELAMAVSDRFGSDGLLPCVPMPATTGDVPANSGDAPNAKRS